MTGHASTSGYAAWHPRLGFVSPLDDPGLVHHQPRPVLRIVERLNQRDGTTAGNGWRSVVVDVRRPAQPRGAAVKERMRRGAAIQQAVCTEYGVELARLVGPQRDQEISEPRKVAMFLCRRLAQMTLPEIGKLFGGRDHTTVLDAVRKIDARAGDPDLAEALAAVTKTVGQT